MMVTEIWRAKVNVTTSSEKSPENKSFPILRILRIYDTKALLAFLMWEIPLLVRPVSNIFSFLKKEKEDLVQKLIKDVK